MNSQGHIQLFKGGRQQRDCWQQFSCMTGEMLMQQWDKQMFSLGLLELHQWKKVTANAPRWLRRSVRWSRRPSTDAWCWALPYSVLLMLSHQCTFTPKHIYGTFCNSRGAAVFCGALYHHSFSGMMHGTVQIAGNQSVEDCRYGYLEFCTTD